MATDVKKIISNLNDFYPFDDKIIISVGAGGGQLIEYGRKARQVIAIDNDEEALEMLRRALIQAGLLNKFKLIMQDFYEVNLKGDALLFEFALHEMKDPLLAIHHAKKMANDVLTADHWPGSEWVDFVDEKEKVDKSWKAMQTFTIRKMVQYDTFQHFMNYDELYKKVSSQGENSIRRIEEFRNRTDFTIPMKYGFILI